MKNHHMTAPGNALIADHGILRRCPLVAFLLLFALLPLNLLTAADAGLCVVFKGLFYEQTSPTTVNPLPGTDFANFRAFASMTAPGSLISGSIRNPANQPSNLVADGMELRFGVDFNSQANMDAMFGSGNYVLSLVTRNDGNRSFTLNLSGNSYPPIPQLNNFNALQAVNPAAPLTLQWAAWTGGTTNDLIMVQIEDSQTYDMVFNTPLPGEPGTLNGQATQVIIPANTFAPNRTYRIMLLFFRPVTTDVMSYPGAMAVAGYLRETRAMLITTGGTPDTQPPWLEDQAPRYGETGVARNAGVAFRFSEPMQSTYSIQWNPPLSFTYQWSADRTILFCFPVGGLLPANTAISYTLNPSGQTGFRDLAGNALPTINSQFTTGSESVSPDVAAYILIKQANYQQTSPTTVVAATNEPPFVFGAFIPLNAPATVTNATFTGGQGLTMEFEGDEWAGHYGATTLTQLDTAFPAGTYSFTIYAVHDGMRQVSLNLPVTSLPNAPRLINYTAAQAIDPNAPFTLTWQPFGGATTNDRIEVEIEYLSPWGGRRTVFTSPDPLGPNALSGTATSLQIPAGTLSPGRSFQAWIAFIKVVATNTTSYPGALGIVAFGANTTVPIATTGQPLRPALRNMQYLGNRMRFEVTGEKYTPCTVEFTRDFRQWWPLRSDWNDTGTLVFEDWNLDASHRFYRVREGW